MSEWWQTLNYVWREDDARPLDRELLPSAITRLIGAGYVNYIEHATEKYDGGDCMWYRLHDGWVVGYGCEGDFVARDPAFDPAQVLHFCPRCFASSDNSSWGEPCDETYCHNCGTAYSGIQMPRWAVKSIREQASWVGKRYYPHDEDHETTRELKILRQQTPIPSDRECRRTTDQSDVPAGLIGFLVRQPMGETLISIVIHAVSEAEALEASRTRLCAAPPEATADPSQ